MDRPRGSFAVRGRRGPSPLLALFVSWPAAFEALATAGLLFLLAGYRHGQRAGGAAP
jgi:hypothetical protein